MAKERHVTREERRREERRGGKCEGWESDAIPQLVTLNAKDLQTQTKNMNEIIEGAWLACLDEKKREGKREGEGEGRGEGERDREMVGRVGTREEEKKNEG